MICIATIRKPVIRALFALALIFAGTTAPAGAGTIFLSGDTNIVGGLLGTAGSPLTAGNQTFFNNVLQGGTTVLVLAGSFGFVDTPLNTYYDGLAGVSSSLFTGTLTAAVLAGVNLLVSAAPDDVYGADEVAAMSGLLAAGGSIFFLGENEVFSDQNAIINGALAALGSGMSVDSVSFDSGFQTATGAQIASNPFTAGVTSLSYAGPSSITGGTVLLSGIGGEPFVAYESTAAAVPAPGTLAVLVIGLAAMMVRVRRRPA